MYRILIAEDESLSRDGLAKQLRKKGIFVVDLAENGETAVKMLSENQYDAVIMDILMPKLTGLQALAKMSETPNNTVKIILSGHEKFEYAQQAIAYGVSEYLLKPLTPELIDEFAIRLEDLIKKTRAVQDERKILQREIESNKPVLRDRFLERLLTGYEIIEQAAARMEYYQLDFPYKFFQVVLIRVFPNLETIQYDETQRQVYDLSLLRKFNNEDSLGIRSHGFLISDGRIAVLINFDMSEPDMANRVDDVLVKKLENFSRFWDVEVFGGKGGVFADLNGIQDSYKQADQAYRWNAVERYTSLVSFSDLDETYEDRLEGFKYEELLMNLKLGKDEEAERWVLSLWEENLQNKPNRYAPRLLAAKIILTCVEASQSLGISMEQDMLKIAFDVIGMEADSLKDSTKMTLAALVKTVGQKIKITQREKRGYYVEAGKKIIEDNYMNNITVEEIADKLQLSKNYFGKLFKMHVGISVANYTNNLRIKKAMDLLGSTNMKVFEVGYAVGYNDQHYFSTTFKQIVGVSPSDYRNML